MSELNSSVIENLTWAIVEASRADGRANLPKIAAVLEAAMLRAITEQEKGEAFKRGLIKTAAAMGI